MSYVRRLSLRLALGLCLSIVLHGILVYGIGIYGVGVGRMHVNQGLLSVSMRPVAGPQTATPVERHAIPAPDGSVPKPVAATPQSEAAAPSDQTAVGPPAPLPWFPNLGLFDEPDLIYYSAEDLDVRAEPMVAIQPTLPPSSFNISMLSGRVILRVLINEQGVVDKVLVEQSEPPGVLDEAAVTAFSNARFRPAMKAGRAVRSQKLIEVILGEPKPAIIPLAPGSSQPGELPSLAPTLRSIRSNPHS